MFIGSGVAIKRGKKWLLKEITFAEEGQSKKNRSRGLGRIRNSLEMGT
jgi:hypothetical protein